MKRYFVSYSTPVGFGRAIVDVPDDKALNILDVERELGEKAGYDAVILYYTEMTEAEAAIFAEVAE